MAVNFPILPCLSVQSVSFVLPLSENFADMHEIDSNYDQASRVFLIKPFLYIFLCLNECSALKLAVRNNKLIEHYKLFQKKWMDAQTYCCHTFYV